MIYSLCIKTNSQKTLDYLLESFENINLSNISLSQNKFKIYQNIILHYRGDMPNVFFNFVADALRNCIIDCHEKNLLKILLNYNYFYFSDGDKCAILKNCMDMLQQEEYENRHQIIFLALLKYMRENRTLVLDGFLHFRVKEYNSILEDICDTSVDKFLIEREYHEFVNLLRMYIDSKPSGSNKIHMVYLNHDSYLFDQHYNLIPRDETLTRCKIFI